MAHEIGHQPFYQLGEAHHDELGLMQDGGHKNFGGDPEPFSAHTLKRFRSAEKWRHKEQE